MQRLCSARVCAHAQGSVNSCTIGKATGLNTFQSSSRDVGRGRCCICNLFASLTTRLSCSYVSNRRHRLPYRCVQVVLSGSMSRQSHNHTHSWSLSPPKGRVARLISGVGAVPSARDDIWKLADAAGSESEGRGWQKFDRLCSCRHGCSRGPTSTGYRC